MKRLGAAAAGCIAALCGILYMAINVTYNYGGNVSGLFYTSPKMGLPPEIDAHTWRVKDELGYDAQYYHLSAHDVFMTGGYWQYVDNPQLRWRRIALPALASLLSGGSGFYTDLAYVAVQIAFLVAGAWWLGLYAASVNLSALAGVAFLFVPAVLVSLDRMTVDLALAALTVAFVYFARGIKIVWPCLVLAPLVRESGLVLAIGWCIWNAVRRQWTHVIVGVACVMPALAWWIHVRAATTPDGTPWLARYPFSGLIERTLSGHGTPGGNAWLWLAGVSEQLALAGIWVAVGLTVAAVVRRPAELPEMIALVFLLFAAALGKYDIWDTAYAAGRTMSPLLVLLALIGMRDRRFVFFAPVLLILPRLALQYQAQLTLALRNSGLL